MKIVIDILTPQQCMLFERLYFAFKREGHQVFLLTREYREVIQLLKMKKLNAEVIGKYGGKGLKDKLEASTKRILGLMKVFDRFDPDLAISFSSPEMARVAFGLGVPHYCVNDSPHAVAVARLTIPICEGLFSPRIIPKSSWTKYGIESQKIIHFNAVNPWAWLKDFKPNIKVLRELGLDKSRPILTFRTEEEFAAYLLSISRGKTILIPFLRKILKHKPDIQIVVIPRYVQQIKALKDTFKDQIIICDSVIDGPSLLYYSSIFVGGGGTMTTEAALLGVPTFSCYPNEPFIILKYLNRKKLVSIEKSAKRLTDRVLSTLMSIDFHRKEQERKTNKLVKNFEDPISVIFNVILDNYYRK